VWRQKVAAYVAWADGPYQTAFETDNLTVAVVCPDETRCAVLADWTLKELRARNAADLAEIFLFTSTSPAHASPRTFFFGSVWTVAGQNERTSLLPSEPPLVAGEGGVVYQSI